MMTMTAMSARDLVSEARASVDELAPADAGRLLAASPTVVDVREPGEFADGHLPGAVNIPRGVMEFKVDEHPALTERDRPLLIYCKAGGRGALAARTLLRMGFARVTNLAGGYDGWVQAGRPVERDPAAC